MATALGSCFTGIESTPRISSGDVRKREAAELTPEQKFLSEVVHEAPARWTAGKRFYVSDDKISIIFQPDAPDVSLTGKELVFESIEDIPSVTGEGASVLTFAVDGVDGRFRYTVNMPRKKLLARDRLEVPFTIESSLVAAISSMMKGNTYYISTPKWHQASDSKAVTGRRHIPVTITRVLPGSYIYPLKVYFSPEGSDQEYWIPMTFGNDRSATRNFDALFHFENPRLRFPRISDEKWQMITESRVIDGMTRDEARLALGAPNSYRTIPVINAIVEEWSYDDGVYLIFEDGILTRFRL